MFRKLSTALIAAFVMLAVSSVAHAGDKPNPLNPKVLGNTYGEWAAEWWQWAVSGPDGENAVQDLTGEFCDLNQPDGNVWFLAGTFGEADVERDCTIPPNKALFYPLVNSVWIDCPDSPDEETPDEVVRAIMSAFGGGGDFACELTSSIDGVDLDGFPTNSISSLQIPAVRTQSPSFSMLLPENHVFADLCDPGPPLLAGETGRSIAEGHWVMVPPLSPGEHVLTLHGASCDFFDPPGDIEIGVTYNLTVE